MANQVKFRLAGGMQPLTLVPVQINGRGPFEFILDTGAGKSILAPEVARVLGVASTGSKEGQTAGGKVIVHLAAVSSLALGSAKVDDLQVAITDLSHIGRTVGAKIDGDVGYDFLKNFRLTIDYHAFSLRLDPPRSERRSPAPAAEIKFRLASPVKPLILVNAHVNGRGPFRFALDTGTSTTAISESLARNLGLQTAAIPPVTTGGAQIRVAGAQLDLLGVGAALRRNVSVVVGEFLAMLSEVLGVTLDGIIGYNFLKEFRVVIDYPNELLFLEST